MPYAHRSIFSMERLSAEPHLSFSRSAKVIVRVYRIIHRAQNVRVNVAPTAARRNVTLLKSLAFRTIYLFKE